MTAVITLNQQQADKVISIDQECAKEILDSAHSNILPASRFVFFAAFDGTGNTLDNVGDPNKQTTNVAQLWRQYEPNISERCGGCYFAGPGTPGTFKASDWLASAVTAQVEKTAAAAYAEFRKQALAWFAKANNPESAVSVVITSFSRGGASAAMFSRLLYETGLKGASGKRLIAPEKISVSAGVLFDPVTTGVKSSVDFAPVITNVIDIFAMNEYRHLFLSTNYRKVEGIKTIDMIGNHCDIGGGYDNGIGAITLQAATKFLSECGLPINDVPRNRRFAKPARDALVHSEGAFGEPPDAVRPWSAYRNFEANNKDFDSSTRLADQR